MTERDRTDSGWGARWAERENKRRRRAYEDAVEAWCLRGIRLLRLRAAAEVSPAESPADLPVDLPEHEVVLAVQPDAELVDVEEGHADLPVPELAVIPVQRTRRAPRLPTGVRVADAGTVVVTDRRVILFGREGDREWTYLELSGLAHHPTAPVTLLHTVGGPVAGLRVPLAAAAHFRLRLTMAYADYIGQRRVVLARLDEAVAANRRSRPPVPVVVTAEHAPGRARLAHPAIIAAALALIALPAYAMTADSSRQPGPHGAFRGGAPITSGASPGTGTVPSAAPTTGPAAPSTTASRTADPDVPSGASAPDPVDPGVPRPIPSSGLIDPAPGPTASPGMVIPADRCGAPENPYGYNYCGGVRVHEPAPDVCRWFTCVEGFWEGRGYLTVCADGRLGMVGGPTGRCPERAGRKEPVYVYQPAAD